MVLYQISTSRPDYYYDDDDVNKKSENKPSS